MLIAYLSNLNLEVSPPCIYSIYSDLEFMFCVIETTQNIIVYGQKYHQPFTPPFAKFAKTLQEKQRGKYTL